MTRDDEKASSRHVKHNIPIDALHGHWRKKHGNEITSPRRRRSDEAGNEAIHWTQGFMHLPSDTELLELMEESDENLQREKDSIYAAAALDVAKKKPKAKSTVILATKKAAEAFDELFPRLD